MLMKAELIASHRQIQDFRLFQLQSHLSYSTNAQIIVIKDNFLLDFTGLLHFTIGFQKIKTVLFYVIPVLIFPERPYFSQNRSYFNLISISFVC